jgi:hypothetical protein
MAMDYGRREGSLGGDRLKTYYVERFEVEEEGRTSRALRVVCPSCDRDFWVRMIWLGRIKLRSGRSYRTRSCPYCFKTAKVPPKSAVN